MSPRKKAKETWDALDAPITFKHMLGVGIFLGALASMGFISPFDRLKDVEKALADIKKTMVTKDDLTSALSGLQSKPVLPPGQR